MKKLMTILAVLTLVVMACSSPTGSDPIVPSGPEPVPVSSVTVTPPTVSSLGVGASIQLSAAISPPNAADKSITWSSANTGIATVDSDGNVTAVAAGTTTISATSANGISGAAQITVVVAATAATGVVVSPASLSLIVGNSAQLSAAVEPEKVSNRNVTWSSSGTTVATVDSNGMVTAISAGTATITARSVLTDTVTGACMVTVSEPTPDVILISSITLNKTSLNLTPPSGSETLTATVLPENASNKTITWSSSNPSVATVGEDTGEVTAVAVGTTEIRATAADGSGVTAICNVTVGIPVTGVTLDQTNLELNAGDERQLTAAITPDNATNKAVTWQSSAPSVAAVDTTGKVTAKATGTAIITVTTIDREQTATCTVIVPDPNVRQKLDDGIDQLVDGHYEAAIASFETAFNMDHEGSSTYVESVVYSSLGKLSSILKEESFRALVAGRLGVVDYPATLDEIFTKNWLAEYAENIKTFYPCPPYYQSFYEWLPENYYGYTDFGEPGWYLVSFVPYAVTATFQSPNFNWPATVGLVDSEFAPGFEAPAWFSGDGSFYQDNLVDMGDRTLKSIVLQEYLFFANLLERNTNGLNELLDEVLSSVFGEAFTSVDSRIKTLDYTLHATLDAEVIEAFELDTIFEGDDIYIGKAELKVLISSLKLIKASLEWLASYNWETDLSYFKGDFGREDAYIEGLFEELKDIDPDDLPLRNNFLKEKGNASVRMNRSKADYRGALGDLIEAWDSIYRSGDIPQAVRDILNDYNWIKDGLTKLDAAINSGATFNVPEELPDGALSAWPVISSSTAAFGVHFTNFFTPGYLGIDNLIANNSTMPQFFSEEDVEITSSSASVAKDFFENLFDTEGNVYVKVDYTNLQNTFPGLLDLPDGSEYINIDRHVAALLYFHYKGWTIPDDWKEDFGVEDH
jgi:uncharacterized protein YjdB